VLPKVEVAEARLLIRIISPEIESTLYVPLDLQRVFVKGHVACDSGEQVRIAVTITQESSEAEATGHTKTFCTGTVQERTAQAVAKGGTKVAAGPAQACAVVTTRLKGEEIDTYSWCKAVTLAVE
jgi:hypothetical protein